MSPGPRPVWESGTEVDFDLGLNTLVVVWSVGFLFIVWSHRGMESLSLGVWGQVRCGLLGADGSRDECGQS